MNTEDFTIPPSVITNDPNMPLLPQGLLDPGGVEIVEINTEEIESLATKEADKMYDELRAMYFDEEFMKTHPVLAKRIQQEVYSLYVLLKMRKSDEIIHDLNLKSIASNPNNASLYRSLKDIQASMLSIQGKIDDKIKDITGLLKEKQLELNYEEENKEVPKNEDGQPAVGSTYRGSKNFIEDMRKNNEEPPKEDPQMDLFEKEEDE